MKAKLLVFLLFISQVLVAQQSFSEKLSVAAISLIEQEVTYDPTYFSIDYPNGDIPKDKGVCTDVIIRAYRKLGIDLQKEVHDPVSRRKNTKITTLPRIARTSTLSKRRRALYRLQTL